MGYRTNKSKRKERNHKTNIYTEFYYHFFRNTLIVSLPLLIISAFILSIPHSSANNSGSDSLAITISSSCTLSSVVNVPHNAEVYNGNYLGDIGKTTITTLCNDGNGYSVYANGYSNNEEGNNKLINSERPEYSIDTGLNTSGLNSAWAMKLNNIPDDPSPTPPTIESDYNNVYGIVPPYWTKVAGRQSGTTDMAQGSSFTTTYAVYASSSQYAGTYQGQVKYLLTHPSYEKPPYYMQEVDAWKNTLALEQSVQAIDKRDGKSYWVTRLKDGNIWMTQNLDLDLEATPNKVLTLTSKNTDLNLYGSIGYNSNNGYSCSNPNTTTNCIASEEVITWTPERSTINFQNTTVDGWTNDNNNPYSANKTDDTSTGHESIGNYYNWTAAIASNNSSSVNNTVETNSICPKGWRLPNAASIAGGYEFSKLLYAYGITTDDKNTTGYTTGGFNKIIASPLYFVRAGYLYGGYNGLGSQGNYWSNASQDNINAYNLYFYNSDINPASYFSRGGGRSVRCLAR